MTNNYTRLINGDLHVTGKVIAKNMSLYDEQFISSRIFYSVVEELEKRIERLENRVFISSQKNGEIVIGEDVLL